MENSILLAQQIKGTISRYRKGIIPLDSLSFQSELLLEEMRSYFSISDHSEAMNCVYVVEEINAVTLAENRSVTQEEVVEIDRCLALLDKLIAPKLEANN